MFTQHLVDAIALNQARAPLYAARSSGRSKQLSTLLVGLERGTLPLAKWLDHRAVPFGERGIGIVADDFVSMDDVAPWHSAPVRTGIASATARRRLRATLRKARREIVAHARARRFDAAAAVASRTLTAIDDLSDGEGAHFAMSRHLVESVGLAAHNARRYNEQSDGDTDRLARDLVASQALGLGLGPAVDRLAQPLHAIGVGIVVNDVPAIPFPAR